MDRPPVARITARSGSRPIRDDDKAVLRLPHIENTGLHPQLTPGGPALRHQHVHDLPGRAIAEQLPRAFSCQAIP